MGLSNNNRLFVYYFKINDFVKNKLKIILVLYICQQA